MIPLTFPMLLLEDRGATITALSADGRCELRWHGTLVSVFSSSIAAIRYMNAEFLS